MFGKKADILQFKKKFIKYLVRECESEVCASSTYSMTFASRNAFSNTIYPKYNNAFECTFSSVLSKTIPAYQ